MKPLINLSKALIFSIVFLFVMFFVTKCASAYDLGPIGTANIDYSDALNHAESALFAQAGGPTYQNNAIKYFKAQWGVDDYWWTKDAVFVGGESWYIYKHRAFVIPIDKDYKLTINLNSATIQYHF